MVAVRLVWRRKIRHSSRSLPENVSADFDGFQSDFHTPSLTLWGRLSTKFGQKVQTSSRALLLGIESMLASSSREEDRWLHVRAWISQ